jgi:hypothetical protein
VQSPEENKVWEKTSVPLAPYFQIDSNQMTFSGFVLGLLRPNENLGFHGPHPILEFPVAYRQLKLKVENPQERC